MAEKDETEAAGKPEEGPPAEVLAKGNKCDASLHHAISKQDLTLCLRLLEDERDVNALDERDGSTPLHALASKKWTDGCAEVAARLLEKGAMVNAKNDAGNTALHIAAREGRLDLCKSLLDHHRATKQLNLNVRRNCNMWTPLHYAAREGQWEVVELLLQEGADPKLQDKNGYLPLHHAAEKGYKDCCRLLASSYTHSSTLKVPPPLALAAVKGYYKCCKEMDPDEGSLQYLDSGGNTPLHLVAKKGFDIFVEMLLDLGAPINVQNKSGNTPLMEAVKNNKLECVRVLAERGASFAERNSGQNTVLHLAASSKAQRCLDHLLSYERIESHLNEKNGRKLSALSISVKKMDETSFSLLVQAGASPTCSPGESLLHFRPVYRRPGMLDTILSHGGPDVRFSNENGVTPLHLAAEEGSKASCALLLSHGARINVLDNGDRSSLYVGAAAGHPEVVRFLVNKGALIRTKEDTKHFTPLHAAAAAGSLKCCQVLLDADPFLRSEQDKANRYALDVAFEGGHHGIVEFLLESFKSLPKDLRRRLHEYTHSSVRTKDRLFLEVIFRSKWWQVGCGLDRAMKEDPCPNFRDIIRPYPNIAYEVMTRCRADSLNNFRLLEDTSYVQRGGPILDEHPVGVMVGCEDLTLLQHPLVKEWLHYKWCSYARWLFMLLLLLRLFAVWALVTFLLYTTNWKQIEKKYNLLEEEICGGLIVRNECWVEAATPWTHPGPLKAFLVHLQLAVSLLLQLAAEVICLKKRGIHHMPDVLALRLPSMVLSLAALLPTSTCELTHGIKSVYTWECGILALLLSWLDLIHNINKLPQFAVYSAVNVNFFKGYIKGLMYLGMVVFVFSFAFHLLLTEQVSFRSVPMSMVQVVVWMVGDLNYDDNFLNANLDYPLLSISLFLLFVCTVGAFFVTLLQAPSSDKKRLRHYKQTGRIYLLLKIDICFPWFRDLCLTYEYNEGEKIPNLFVKILEHFGWVNGDTKSETITSPPNPEQGQDVTPPAMKGNCSIDKLVTFFENMADFFQMDENDNDKNEDDGAQAVDLTFIKKTMEQHTQKLEDLTSRLDQLLRYCEERNTFDQDQRT